LLFSLLLVAIIGSTIAGTTAGKMTGDLYVFAYSWEPEFCYGTTYPGCSAPQPYWSKNFIVHGLWPQYSAGGYPATCSTEPFNASVPNAVGYTDMITYWPNVQAAEGTPEYTSFWEHEWTKHGSCTGLSQETYFSTALNLIKKFGTPTAMSSNVGGTVDAGTLRTAFGGATSASLQCSSTKYINGVYTCWSQNNGIPVAQVVCPADVQKEDTCTSATLAVQSF